jgi:hypothetical protein
VFERLHAVQKYDAELLEECKALQADKAPAAISILLKDDEDTSECSKKRRDEESSDERPIHPCKHG